MFDTGQPTLLPAEGTGPVEAAGSRRDCITCTCFLSLPTFSHLVQLQHANLEYQDLHSCAKTQSQVQAMVRQTVRDPTPYKAGLATSWAPARTLSFKP